MLPLHKILCSTDFSEPSFAALEVAGERAADFGAELCLAYIVEPMESPGFVLSMDEIEESMQADAPTRCRNSTAS